MKQALADYEAATQADPKFASERPKGFLLFYLGRMTQSAEMFEKHMKSDPMTRGSFSSLPGGG